MTKQRRRQAGEGSISRYETKTHGHRWLIKYTGHTEDGTRKVYLERGYPDAKTAAAALRRKLTAVECGTHVPPSKTTVEAHMAEWLDGLRLAPATLASYRKNVRLHVVPYLGGVQLAKLTPGQINTWLRKLESTGRADGTGGLSARTVRYVFTVVRAALADAVHAGRLAVNPTDRAKPPSAAEARSPEMRAWTAAELGTFLDWTAGRKDELHVAWRLLASTGMRRGEALALRWRDVDLDAGRLSVRRSVGVIKTKGAGEEILEGPTKSGGSRVVGLDADTMTVIRGYRADRGRVALGLIRDDALVLGGLDGRHRHPERFSRSFVERVAQCRRALGEDTVSVCRLHDLRHTHATMLLADGVPVKVVSQRLGHANATMTLNIYQHVMPGMDRQAADRFGALLGGGS